MKRMDIDRHQYARIRGELEIFDLTSSESGETVLGRHPKLGNVTLELHKASDRRNDYHLIEYEHEDPDFLLPV